MSSKGKQISVIIAGATGSTGREIVSRLVSHPDVSRVVALARSPIPVNRWTSVFPHLHASDARRYLSVVPVDWNKILADVSHIPSSYVSDGIWRFDDAEKEWRQFERHFRLSQSRYRARLFNEVDAEFHGAPAPSWAVTGSSKGGGGKAGGLWSIQAPQGYVKLPPLWTDEREEYANAVGDLGSQASSAHSVKSGLYLSPYASHSPYSSFSSATGSASVDLRVPSVGDKGMSEKEMRRWSQEFLRQILQNSFYRSVFSGHQVAINCIGTSHFLSSAELSLVDFDLSIAFAKVVRLFNCMAHAEPTEDEERRLVEANSKELDSVLWNEISAACYGKRDTGSPREASHVAPGSSPCGPWREQDSASRTSPYDIDFASTTASQPAVQLVSGASAATLRHFSQLSVRGAAERSPFSYLRVHGRRDKTLLKLFHRWRGDRISAPAPSYIVAPSKNSLLLGTPSTLSHTTPSLIKRTSKIFGRTLYGRGGNQRSSRLAPSRDGNTAILSSPASSTSDNLESEARYRARALLRRDVVRIWENANLTIWRPGVLARSGRRRVLERIFGLVERPLNVKCLAECIVDDIVESFYRSDDSRHSDPDYPPPRLGTVKVINGTSVARRVHMKAIEDGLNAEDVTKPLK